VKRLTAFLAALLLSATAQAQFLLPDGSLNGACASVPRSQPLPVPTKTIPAQTELPAQLRGAGTSAVVHVGANGVAVGWWVARSGSPTLYLYAVTWTYLLTNPDLLARVAALAVSGDRTVAQAAAIGAAAAPTLHIQDMCDIWAPLVVELNASKPPLIPILSPYVVTAGKPRPAYAVINGKRSTAFSGTAVPGQPCDCATLQIIEFNVFRYCASPSITGITGPAVTSCTARPK
jgi:hypothetical protein